MAPGSVKSGQPARTALRATAATSATSKKPPKAQTLKAEVVLEWIQRYIKHQGLTTGDSLPKEIEIAQATGASRSSVREALTSLKVLGIVRSRRHGGIRIMRPPVLLGIREFLIEEYGEPARFRQALEFRAIIELGMAQAIVQRIDKQHCAALRQLLADVKRTTKPLSLQDAEIQFHAILAQVVGNQLVLLLSEIYRPIFRSYATFSEPHPAYGVAEWTRDHLRLIEPLEEKDQALFVRRMQEHVAPYLTRGP
jgi:GntR family transcriptional repressor for pyruvate dehydrogenase complex